jgi:hypothetical protein
MFISYFDESGDDGYPTFSSDFFILSSLYLHYTNWHQIFQSLQQFRQHLKKKIWIASQTRISCKRICG